MDKKVKDYHNITHTLYYLHKSMKWKHKDDTCVRVIGYMEVNLATMKPEWYRRIMTAVAKGYVSGKGAWVKHLELVAEYNPVQRLSIGYVGRSAASVFFPLSAPVFEYRDMLNTLWATEHSNGTRPFVVRTTDDGYYLIANVHQPAMSRRNRYDNRAAPEARLMPARRLIEQQLANHIDHRQPLLDYLETKPSFKVPFASHTKDWKWR